MSCSRVIVSLTCLLMLMSMVAAMPPVQCNPNYSTDVPARIHKICVALNTLYELGSAMESYVNDKVPVMHDGDLLMDNGVKRQDVDHVFLRFGKRSAATSIATDKSNRLLQQYAWRIPLLMI